MPIDKADFNALLAEVSKIADALNNPRPTELSEEPPAAAAASHVDYLAVRQLMGRVPRAGEPAVVFPARRVNTGRTHPQLELGPVPDGATKVAVFVGRGVVAEDVDLTSHPTFDPKKKNTTKYPLTVVTQDQVITRLEFRRDDDYPLALGPRLPVV
ncbi:MAG: hypothetical protein JWR85_3186 [Marmoricola sp.]|nr:hypothetical protein [Marmoricola sp.]